MTVFVPKLSCPYLCLQSSKGGHYMTQATANELPLALCAQRLGKSWGQTWRLMLRGTLKGRKVDGRWFVNAEDVERLARENGEALEERV